MLIGTSTLVVSACNCACQVKAIFNSACDTAAGCGALQAHVLCPRPVCQGWAWPHSCPGRSAGNRPLTCPCSQHQWRRHRGNCEPARSPLAPFNAEGAIKVNSPHARVCGATPAASFVGGVGIAALARLRRLAGPEGAAASHGGRFERAHVDAQVRCA